MKSELTKICTKCSVEKQIYEFIAKKSSKDGHGSSCKVCRNKNRKKHKYNPEKQRLAGQKFRKAHKYRIKEDRKKYEKSHRKEITEKGKKYRKANPEKAKEYAKRYRNKNKDKINKNRKKYIKDNSEKIKEKRRKYDKDRKKRDIVYKLKHNIRSAIGMAIKNKGYSQKSRTHEILGCSYEEFKIYLESKFEPWMTWDNYGKYNGTLNYGWDIDHIIPIASAITEEDVIRLSHHANFQPLCSYINRVIKRDKTLY